MRARSLVTLLALAAILASHIAQADDVVVARKYFVEGVRRFQDGDFEGARASFRGAEAEHHAAVTVYNIALAEERLSHPQLAVDAYQAYLAEAGNDAEFGAAALLAVEQIKGRSPRVRVETRPPGARVFVDGSPLADATPATTLVAVGRHHIAVEGEGWRDEADIEAQEPSRVATVLLVKPATPDGRSRQPPPIFPNSAEPRGPDSLIFGAELSLVTYEFLPNKNHVTTLGVAFAGTVDLGYALTDTVEIMGRVLGGIGSEGTPFTSIYAVGPAVSWRVLRSLWLGAGFLGGKADTNARQVYFSTDYVFSPMVEVSYAVLDKPYGQWMFSAKPSFFLASPGDNSCFYLPIGFGFRGY